VLTSAAAAAAHGRTVSAAVPLAAAAHGVAALGVLLAAIVAAAHGATGSATVSLVAAAVCVVN
jgi:hypothetical protein